LVLLAGEGIPDYGLAPPPVDEESEAVAAALEVPIRAPTFRLGGSDALRHGEARGGDAVHDGSEDEVCVRGLPHKEAEQRRLLPPVVFPEALDEIGVTEDVSPLLADEGGACKGGRLRSEAEEDLLQQVLAVQGTRRGTAAAHIWARVGDDFFQN
jgi:hypothetical protein